MNYELRITKTLKWVALGVIGFYQRFISPFATPCCRFQPTCSHYGQLAVEKHGAIKGLFLTLARIIKCNPLSPIKVDLP